MKYILTESQYNRLLSENEMKKYFRRRLPEIKLLIHKEMEENDPNDFKDEFEYASNIITWVIGFLDEFDYDTMNEDDLKDLIKEYFSEIIFDHYHDNVNDEDNDF
jgi:hypothetical protein